MTKLNRQYKRCSTEFKREALLRASEEGMTGLVVLNGMHKTARGLAPAVRSNSSKLS